MNRSKCISWNHVKNWKSTSKFLDNIYKFCRTVVDFNYFLYFRKEISLWEEKMIRLGHIDVIRHGNLIDPPEPKPKKL